MPPRKGRFIILPAMASRARLGAACISLLYPFKFVPQSDGGLTDFALRSHLFFCPSILAFPMEIDWRKSIEKWAHKADQYLNFNAFLLLSFPICHVCKCANIRFLL
jgi:hypothetical protein